VKNAVWAWVTILVMGLGTAAAATHAMWVERAGEQGRVVRAKRPKMPKPAAMPEPVVESPEAAAAPKVEKVKPAPRNPVDTRELSRVSRRQA
jgi:hypothetical protein